MSKNQFAIIAVAIAMQLAFASSAQAQEGVEPPPQVLIDEDLRFSLRLPAGFVSRPDLINPSLDYVHAFSRGDLLDAEPDIVLVVERMRGAIPHERLNPSDIPAGGDVRLFTVQWNGLDIDAVEILEDFGDVQMVTFNVQIPLRHEAIQLKLIGAADRRTELLAMLSEILAGLQGQTNWGVPTKSSLRTSEHYGAVLGVCAIVFFLGGVVAFMVISRKTHRGTVLAIGAVLWVVSWRVAAIGGREMLVLGGATRALGLTGVILGIVYLLRRRKPADK